MNNVTAIIENGVVTYYAPLCGTCKGKKLFPSDGSDKILSVCSTCNGSGIHPVMQLHMLNPEMPNLFDQLLSGVTVKCVLPDFPATPVVDKKGKSIYRMAAASREPNWNSVPISYRQFMNGKRPIIPTDKKTSAKKVLA